MIVMPRQGLRSQATAKEPEETNELTSLSISLPIADFVDMQVTSLTWLRRYLHGHPLPSGWAEYDSQGCLILYKIAIDHRPEHLTLSGEFMIRVHNDLSWSFSSYGAQVDPKGCSLFSEVSCQLTSARAVLNFLDLLEGSQVCCGNAVSDYGLLVDARGGIFNDHSGTRQVATTDAWFHTIRHVDCERVIPISRIHIRCRACVAFRPSLRVQASRLAKKSATDRTTADSHVPYSALSSEEMQVRMRNLHDELRRMQKHRDWLKGKLEALVEKEGVTVDETMNQDLLKIIEEEGSKKVDSNVFQRVFWEQQVQAASKSDSRSMKWHPAMIRWCLYLRYRSSSAYEMLRRSGCLHLPSQRTLRDYTHVTSSLPVRG